MAQAFEATAEPEGRLRSLIARGFRFVHPRDARGNIVAVVGVRAHHSVIDVVELWSEGNVTARRIPGDESNVLEPERELWGRSGPSATVLEELLGLDDEYPADPRATGRRSGCWVPVRPGHETWLAATA
jgi:hypothetical protein